MFRWFWPFKRRFRFGLINLLSLCWVLAILIRCPSFLSWNLHRIWYQFQSSLRSRLWWVIVAAFQMWLRLQMLFWILCLHKCTKVLQAAESDSWILTRTHFLQDFLLNLPELRFKLQLLFNKSMFHILLPFLHKLLLVLRDTIIKDLSKNRYFIV